MEFFREAGITEASSQEEIRATFLLLARTHHPDRGGDTATFQAIHRAYEGLAGGSFKPIELRDLFSELFELQGEAMLDSMYESLKKCLMGSQSSKRTKGVKGPDKFVDLFLPLSDIYWGRTVVVQINRECLEESGELVPDRCLLELNVTPHVKEIRCERKCSDNIAFDQPGDIVFIVKSEANSVWRISEDGQDIKTTVVLDFAESLLGWSRVLEGHPSEKSITVSVKDRVTLNDTDIVIADAGMPLPDGSFGSLIVRCKVNAPEMNPSALSTEERQFLSSIFPTS